ncbi:helix-turn-helix domain-containing protein [Pedobacter aquatilis]|uniref:helix-turn-helix domain-containing protein n=1 Tax=Pedobacter aquatilis TaxID=351343 RepID=UPI0025B5597A|nr:helix-turn-helix domain-containing protein [Pedobacter aquatilis]MDN3585603.1 helix-turn-helix domain-containing protein [Pedobacter aquatilis]
MENNANVEESYLKIEAAAAFLSSTRGAFQIMTHRKTIPHIKKMGKLYFRKSDLVKWLEDGAVDAQ